VGVSAARPGKAIDTAGQQQQQRWQVPPPSKAMASMTSTVLVLALGMGMVQQGSVPAAISAALATAANQFAPLFFDAFERNQLPDAVTRIGIRNLLGGCRCLLQHTEVLAQQHNNPFFHRALRLHLTDYG